MLNDYLRVAAISPKVKVGHPERNLDYHFQALDETPEADVYLFPELSLTGYTCEDLFGDQAFIRSAWDALDNLRLCLRDTDKYYVVGVPVLSRETGSLYNCAAVIQAGKILGLVPKCYLPNYNEFYEARWFNEGIPPNEAIPTEINGIPFGTDLLFPINSNFCMGVEICEDLWAQVPPSTYHALNGANLLLNLSASNETIAKAEFRRNLVAVHSARFNAAYVYASAGPRESTKDIVFGGHCIIAENGTVIAENERFSFDGGYVIADVDGARLFRERSKAPRTFGRSATQYSLPYRRIERELGMTPTITEDNFIRKIDAHPFVPKDIHRLHERCNEIISIQTTGLANRLLSMGEKPRNVYIGVSGGLDSTHALLITSMAYDLLRWDRKNIVAITMPGFGTSDRTKNNSYDLIDALGVTTKEIDVREASLAAFHDMGHKPFGMSLDMINGVRMGVRYFEESLQTALKGRKEFHARLEEKGIPYDSGDLVFENVQARLRTFYLMSHGFVVGTGDLTEILVGWSTYNGDHMSMYNVNCSVSKTMMKFLIDYIAKNVVQKWENGDRLEPRLLDIVDTPISPELLPLILDQKTETSLGPLELLDFFGYNFVRQGFDPQKILFLATKAFKDQYTKDELRKHLRTFFSRFFNAQFKRDCVPGGPKVGSVSLSPRGDWRMPTETRADLWLKELEE